MSENGENDAKNDENTQKLEEPLGTPNNPYETRSKDGKYRLTHYEYSGKERNYVHFPCQRREGNSCSVPVNGTKTSNNSGWTFDGNLESPTLGPSIRCLFNTKAEPLKNRTRCHFFLKKGEFELCGDHTSERHLDTAWDEFFKDEEEQDDKPAEDDKPTTK